MDVRVGLCRKLSAEELNCGVGEDSWESLGLKGDPTSLFWRRLVLDVLWKEWCSLELKLQYFGHLMWKVDSLEMTLMLGWMGSRRRGDNKGWDGWMASLIRWTWVWVNSGSWWWTGGQGGTACCDSWGRKESDTTERLNCTELKSFHGDSRSSWLTENFCKMSASWHWTPLSPKPYTLTFPHFHFGTVSQSYLRSCRMGCSPHFVPDKT